MASTTLGFILGRWRDSSKKVFSKKLEIYSEIVYEINAFKFSYVKVKQDKNKLEKILSSHEGKVSYLLGGYINDKKEKLQNKEDILTYKDNLIKLFAPARLLGSKEVIIELREYYSLIGEYFDADSQDSEKIITRISISTMKLEQLMREDLIGFWAKTLSDNDIRQHIKMIR